MRGALLGLSHHLKQALSHILWLGGSPCSGKSSIAEILVEKYGLQSYSCDHAFPDHQKRITPHKHPTFYELSQMTWDQIWMRPVSVQLAREVEIYREEFELILEDLLALPKSRPILAEGAALLPDCVSGLLQTPQQAMWIVPTDTFQRTHYARRPWIHDILSHCQNPEQAFQNWMDRDAAFARWVSQKAAELQLSCHIVDGQQTIAENAALVARYFQL